MKKQFILLTIAVVAAISLLLVCCHDAESPSESSPTNVERLLASPEYEAFSNEIDLFSVQTAQALSSLSPDKQKRMDEICTAIPTCKDRENFIALAKEMFTILNVDYEQHSRRMNRLSKNLLKGQKLTTNEIFQFMEKRSRLQSSKLLTRSDTPTTSPYEACIRGCQSTLNALILICETSHDHATAEEADICRLERETAAVVCQRDCENNYQTPPPTVDTTQTTEPIGPETTDPEEPTKPTEPGEPTLPPTTTTNR